MNIVKHLIAGIFLLSATSFAQSQEKMTVVDSEKRSMSATVQSIDPDARTITLERRSGSTLDMEVSPEVTLLENVQKGERIKAEYLEPVALSIEYSGREDSAAEVPDRVLVRDEQDKSSETEVETESYPATVESIDPVGRTAVLRKSNGNRFRVYLSSNLSNIGKIDPADKITVKATPLLVVKIEGQES